MIKYCNVSKCKNRSQQGGFSHGDCERFYRFPHKNPELLKKWLIAIQRTDWKPGKYSNVCSAHFQDEDFRKMGTRYYLKEDVVPSVFNFPESNQSPKAALSSSSNVALIPSPFLPSSDAGLNQSSDVNRSSQTVLNQVPGTSFNRDTESTLTQCSDMGLSHNIVPVHIDHQYIKSEPGEADNIEIVDLDAANRIPLPVRDFSSNAAELCNTNNDNTSSNLVCVSHFMEMEVKDGNKVSKKVLICVKHGDRVTKQGGVTGAVKNTSIEHKALEKNSLLLALQRQDTSTASTNIRDIIKDKDLNNSLNESVTEASKTNASQDKNRIVITNIRTDRGHDAMDTAESNSQNNSITKTLHNSNQNNYSANSMNTWVGIASTKTLHCSNSNNYVASINAGVGAGTKTLPFSNINNNNFTSQNTAKPLMCDKSTSTDTLLGALGPVVNLENVSFDHSYGMMPSSVSQLHKKILHSKERNKILETKLKAAKSRLINYERRVMRLKEMVISQKDIEMAVHRRALGLIEDALGAGTVGNVIVQNCIEGMNNSGGIMYSENLKSWATSLYAQSPKAYDTIRATFKNSLPNSSTLRRWRAESERLNSDLPLRPIVEEPSAPNVSLRPIVVEPTESDEAAQALASLGVPPFTSSHTTVDVSAIQS